MSLYIVVLLRIRLLAWQHLVPSAEPAWVHITKALSPALVMCTQALRVERRIS